MHPQHECSVRRGRRAHQHADLERRIARRARAVTDAADDHERDSAVALRHEDEVAEPHAGRLHRVERRRGHVPHA
eukprot:2547606-Prymnesium_polylepis.1